MGHDLPEEKDSFGPSLGQSYLGQHHHNYHIEQDAEESESDSDGEDAALRNSLRRLPTRGMDDLQGDANVDGELGRFTKKQPWVGEHPNSLTSSNLFVGFSSGYYYYYDYCYYYYFYFN